MKLILKKRAVKALLAVAQWVESQNTEGAGDRWLEKVFSEFDRRAKAGVKHSLCSNHLLAKRQYSCFPYGDWIVAYKIYGNEFIICRFVWGAKLV